MKVGDKVVGRLAELIERGLEIERTKKRPPPNFIGFDSTVDSQAGNQWQASAKNILARSFGTDSEHYELFDACFEQDVTYSPLHREIGIPKAAEEELEHFTGRLTPPLSLSTARCPANEAIASA